MNWRAIVTRPIPATSFNVFQPSFPTLVSNLVFQPRFVSSMESYANVVASSICVALAGGAE